MSSLTLVTDTTPTPADAILSYLDGTNGDGHAATLAAATLTAEAMVSLAPDFPAIANFDLKSAMALVLRVVVDLRVADEDRAQQ